MPSAFSGLEIAKRALYAQQSALHTTGHNIANANTEGYTRQRVNMEATTPYPYPSLTNDRQAGQMGTGVMASSIERLRERFLDLQVRGETKNVGYYEAKADTLEKIEVIMNEPSDKGFQYTMDKFWNSWHTVASNPKDQAARETLRQNAVTMTENFAFIHDSLTKMQDNLNDEVKVSAEEINSYAQQIASINKRIADIVPHGYQPNDLYDQRDVLLDKLSKLVDISVKETNNGMVDVTINANAKGPTATAPDDKSSVIPLVTGISHLYTHAVKVTNSGNGKESFQVRFTDTSDYAAATKTKEYSAVDFKSGELAGLLESRGDAEVVDMTDGSASFKNGIIPDYVQRIKSLATEMFKAINDVHKQGYNLDDIKNQNATPEGLPFFVSKSNPGTHPTYNPPANAADIEVNPEIMKSVNKIAIASKQDPSNASESIPGEEDNRNALAIFALKHKSNIIFGSETTSFDGYTRGIVAKLGIETSEAQRMKGNSELLMREVENRRQSISGVSLDEEMSNMIKFQHAYNAAARTVTAVDEMLDKIINGMGLVGR